jgi:hypothetical protein
MPIRTVIQKRPKHTHTPHRPSITHQSCKTLSNSHLPSSPTPNTILHPLQPQTTRLSRLTTFLTDIRTITPALTALLQNPSTREDSIIISVIDMAMVELGIALEQIKHILHAELSDSLAAFDGGLGQFALSFLQFEDAFFD